MKQSLFIICGIQFSGKTYLANHIHKKSKAKIISFDEINKNNKQKFDKKQIASADRWIKVKRLAMNELKRELKRGNSVIWDSTNPKRLYRDELKAIAEEFKVKSKLIFLDTPIDTIIYRKEKNNILSKRHMISNNDFITTIKEMEVPSEDENAYCFKPGDDLNLIIKNLLI